AEEIFDRTDLVGELLRNHADRIEHQLDVLTVIAIDAESRSSPLARRGDILRSDLRELAGVRRFQIGRECVARKDDALAHRRIPSAAHPDDDEPSFEDREPLRDVVIDDVVVEDWTRKTAVDELRSEGLSRADELGDVVLFQA